MTNNDNAAIRTQLYDMIEAWTVKAGGYVIHQRVDKVRGLLEDFGVASINDLADGKLVVFRRALDDMINKVGAIT